VQAGACQISDVINEMATASLVHKAEFVRTTNKGTKIVKERYLRTDLSCLSELCERDACHTKMFQQSLSGNADYYLMPGAVRQLLLAELPVFTKTRTLFSSFWKFSRLQIGGMLSSCAASLTRYHCLVNRGSSQFFLAAPQQFGHSVRPLPLQFRCIDILLQSHQIVHR